MKLTEYIVFVSWFDELSSLVLDAASPEEAVAKAKDSMVSLARERCTYYGWNPAEIEAHVSRYRDYDYRASTTAKSLASSIQNPLDLEQSLAMFKRWREPRLPTGCPSSY